MTHAHSSFLPPLYGLMYVVLLMMVSYTIASLPAVAHSGLSSLVIAIVVGMIIGNLWHYPPAWAPGIQLAAKQLLRLAIILYGFRISFQQIASVGIQALILDVFIVATTLVIGYGIARKCFKLDKDMALLISSGAAICGVAAVLAVEEVIKSEPYKATVAVGTVVLFGTLSMFTYPLLQKTGILGFTDHQFGVFTGGSIHEVAQALVAGANVSSEASKIAVIVKMMRVLLLVPVLFLLAIWHKRIAEKTSHHPSVLVIPWFAMGFVIVIGFNSLQWLPSPTLTLINQGDTILLTMAMAAIGIETKMSKIKKVGMTPLYLALLLLGWLMTTTFMIVKFI